MNREFQLRILTECKTVYPGTLDWKSLIRLYKNEYSAVEIPDDDEELLRAFVWASGSIFCVATVKERCERLPPPQELMATIAYLEELGLLVSSNHSRGQTIPDVKITAHGIDFLADDGGLSAILNTVTVKFDIESTRELLASGLLSMGVPEEKKGILRKAIEGATTDTIKELVKSVLRNPKGAMDAAQNLLNVVF